MLNIFVRNVSIISNVYVSFELLSANGQRKKKYIELFLFVQALILS